MQTRVLNAFKTSNRFWTKNLAAKKRMLTLVPRAFRCQRSLAVSRELTFTTEALIGVIPTIRTATANMAATSWTTLIK